jgi:uncharacterized membrane protein YczE
MTKIEEFENRIIKNGITEGDFAEYERLLRRVHDNFLKLQHCYITAIKFPVNRADSAVALIEWGLDRFPSDWFPTYFALDHIGWIRERNGQYRLAYDAYLRAADVLGEDHLSYSQSLSGSLMWMLLHIDNFTYSKQLEDYYNAFNCIDNFEKAFVNNEFRLYVAETVISLHYGKSTEAREAYENAIKLSKPGFVSRIQNVLDRHNVKDVLRNTPECSLFLKRFPKNNKGEKNMPEKKPIRRFGEAAYVLGTVLCALGVCLSAKSGLGVSTVVAPAFILSSYLEPIAPFFTFGNTEYLVQGILLILVAVFMKRVTLSYPLSLVTAVIYGVTLDLWRLVFGTDPVEEIYLKIIFMIIGALITGMAIAMMLRSYLPQQAYDFAVKEISVVKKFNMNKVKWIYDIVSLIVAIALMLILFHKFDLSLIGIGTLIIAAVNAPMIGLFGKLFDKFIDFSPLFPRFANKVFKVKIEEENSDNA